jgi:hypothetical protein
MGRHRMRWKKDVEKDLRQMKFQRWRQKEMDREEMPPVIKDAKAVRGP